MDQKGRASSRENGERKDGEDEVEILELDEL